MLSHYCVYTHSLGLSKSWDAIIILIHPSINHVGMFVCRSLTSFSNYIVRTSRVISAVMVSSCLELKFFFSILETDFAESHPFIRPCCFSWSNKNMNRHCSSHSLMKGICDLWPWNQFIYITLLNNQCPVTCNCWSKQQRLKAYAHIFGNHCSKIYNSASLQWIKYFVGITNSYA